MRFHHFKTLIETYLHSLDPKFADILCYPGPNDPSIPTAYILLTKAGGPGENTEGKFDGKGYQVKSVSEQNDYDSGEEVAEVVDLFLRSLPSARYEGFWVTSFQRVGSGPTALYVDDADRTHFVCSYIIDVESAI